MLVGLIFSLVLIIVVFINFSLVGSKINFVFVRNIFIEIKIIRVFLVKLIMGLLLLLLFNYNRYIYYRVGVRINYGYVFIYALRLILFSWCL